jgi:RimJ/RimL family protein N-acetyltransferase
MLDIRTERLFLQPVSARDLDQIATLFADARVMATLGGTTTRESCDAWLARKIESWRVYELGPFVVRQDGGFVGLVGLSRGDFDAGFTPGIEIAWRLAFDHWGKGYATEAARAVVRDAFDRLGLTEIVAVTTPNNPRSRRVMERLGMVHSPSETFEHPRVPEGNPLRTHIVYRLRL